MFIIAYCLDWHTTTSNAFHDLVVEPLSPYAEIKLVAWDGKTVPSDDDQHPAHLPRIFCMLPPPADWLAKTQTKTVWIPMADYSPDAIWNNVSKSVRVVSFSNTVEKQAHSFGLKTLRLRYFKNPQSFAPAQWDNGRVLLYWNRTGLIGPQTLEKLCNVLAIDTLLFRSKIDPRITSEADYSLPSKLGHTIVQEYPELTSSREQYLTLLQQANIFIAPRLIEGVGMSNLEALASGCMVLANRAPTMDEYIKNGETGYFLDTIYPPYLGRIVKRVGRSRIKKYINRIRRKIRLSLPSAPYSHPITPYQNWRALGQLEPRNIGNQARLAHEVGYEIWQNDIETYAHFVLD
jgi:glycosyltransferase involved in cell wall biosynthesis